MYICFALAERGGERERGRKERKEKGREVRRERVR